MRFFIFMYLLVIFHLPVWTHGYRNHKYRCIGDMPAWMSNAISIRNKFERNNNLIDVFYWLKVGRFYIRKRHSMPAGDLFYASRKHLFVIKKLH